MGRETHFLTADRPWRTAVVCLAAVLTFVVAGPAAARERDRSPSAEELWRTYPLHSRGPTAMPEEPAAAPAARAVAVDDGDGGPPSGLFVLPIIAAAGGAAALLWLRRRRRDAPSEDSAAPVAKPAVPALRRTSPPLFASTAGALGAGGPRPVQATAARRSDPRRPDSGPAGAGAPASEVPEGGIAAPAAIAPAATALPPDPASVWVAEAAWNEADGHAWFHVVARDPDGLRESTVAESARFDWPPSEATGVQTLTAAAERLESALLAAGWTPLPPGSAWYAKRFAWEARTGATEPATAAPPSEPRGADAAPAQASCEIEWGTALVNSRFQAVVHDPGSRRGRPVGVSAAKWFFMSDPDPALPEVHAALRRLADTLEAAGWEPAGRGRHWYSERFAWRGAGPAPEVNSR
jgi:hypothetical protein